MRMFLAAEDIVHHLPEYEALPGPLTGHQVLLLAVGLVFSFTASLS